jgi:hypothetical protein
MRWDIIRWNILEKDKRPLEDPGKVNVNSTRKYRGSELLQLNIVYSEKIENYLSRNITNILNNPVTFYIIHKKNQILEHYCNGEKNAKLRLAGGWNELTDPRLRPGNQDTF